MTMAYSLYFVFFGEGGSGMKVKKGLINFNNYTKIIQQKDNGNSN